MVQVWVSYAYFEATPSDIHVAEAELEEGEDEAGHVTRVASMRGAVPRSEWEEYEVTARNVYSRGYARMRENEPDAKAEAALLLDEWLRFERGCRSLEGEAKSNTVRVVEGKVRACAPALCTCPLVLWMDAHGCLSNICGIYMNLRLPHCVASAGACCRVLGYV
jgi:hypothetical protein